MAKVKKGWLKERDKNTRFFHKMVSFCRRRNYMDKPRVNSKNLVGEDKIKVGMSNAFLRIINRGRRIGS